MIQNETEAMAKRIFEDIDRNPSDQVVRFMRGISKLFLDDPHIKVLRLAAIIQETMPNTMATYNGFTVDK